MTESSKPQKGIHVLLIVDSIERRSSVERSLAVVGCEVVGHASSHDNLLGCARGA